MELKAEKGLISLKEAAGLSGYSADYIGQLIRAGKIPGKQVCCNVAWMTTAEAVTAYKNKGNASVKPGLKEKAMNHVRQMRMELDIIKLFFKTFKYSLPVLIAFILIFSVISIYAFNLALSAKTRMSGSGNIDIGALQNISF